MKLTNCFWCHIHWKETEKHLTFSYIRLFRNLMLPNTWKDFCFLKYMVHELATINLLTTSRYEANDFEWKYLLVISSLFLACGYNKEQNCFCVIFSILSYLLFHFSLRLNLLSAISLLFSLSFVYISFKIRGLYQWTEGVKQKAAVTPCGKEERLISLI